ncbi:aminopeptidase N [Longispora albida]|uniref:aminopeptidase N n=1 Tax=Longispora albida TaxID=203523 RepID=UPI000361E814|nr:aminopeptidase N [Longispora albida]
MAGTRNLAQTEAIERARLLEVHSYDIALDLTDGGGKPGERTFRSRSEIHFTCTEPGASTFIEVAADTIESATLNGAELDTSAWTAETGLTVPGLAADNVLVVTGQFLYSNSGMGLHRFVDPVDGEVYLYSQFETADAQRTYACFDQPDLKSVATWHVTAPQHWKVISNALVASVEDHETGAKVTHFEPGVKMSTYINALCAGPYHEVTSEHDGIALGLYCRSSLAEHFDPDDIFLITRQGFDFFHEQFGVRYPLPKYDQIFVPEYNAGAMENFGCVTFAEDSYVFRSTVTDFEYEQRSNTILHEMAHMWFGDLVTMQWWDDLWLNESFAEWAAHWANAKATRFTDAWTTFLSARKNWGYRQDQLSSTHPVYCDTPDVETVEVNFDGITYAKGASVLKQLVAYVGEEAFVAGLREYFRKHAWGNTVFGDLLAALEETSGRKLGEFAAQWLETAQVNTLRPRVTVAADGTYESVVIEQEAPEDYPTLRQHRIALGLYDLADGKLHRRERIELDIAGASTVVEALAGVRQPDVLLLNEDDLTYAKIRFDERSAGCVREHIAGFTESLPRGLAWASAWDALRDGELAARDYVALVANGLPAEDDINLVTVTAKQAQLALSQYADPAWSPAGWELLSGAARGAVENAEPGSGLQLAWARTFSSTARSEADLAVLQGWLEGKDVPAGLSIDTGFRWHLVQNLTAQGKAGQAEIDAQLATDPTATGKQEALLAQALIPTAEAKAAAWERITGEGDLTNMQARYLLLGFQHPSQVELTKPYVAAFFDKATPVWELRDGDIGQMYAVWGFPKLQVSEDTIAATDAWLAQDSHPAPLRRLIAEGRDDVLRAIKARAADAR